MDDEVELSERARDTQGAFVSPRVKYGWESPEPTIPNLVDAPNLDHLVSNSCRACPNHPKSKAIDFVSLGGVLAEVEVGVN